MKKYLKTVVCTFTLGILLGVGAMAAFADIATSAWKYFGPIGGFLTKICHMSKITQVEYAQVRE